jgi:hypothetical protein
MIATHKDERHSKLYNQGERLESRPRPVFEALLVKRNLSLDAAAVLLQWGKLKLKTIRSQSKNLPVSLFRKEWQILGL